MPDDGTQRAAIEFLVVGDDDLSIGFVAAKDHMASLLPLQHKTGSLEGFDALSPGNNWEFAHTSTTETWKRSSGTGSPSASSAAV